MEINGYGKYASGVGNTSGKVKVDTKTKELGMNDFLNLIVAQMKNQDINNPMDNTQFIAQMAQFSSLQAMNDLAKVSLQGQATALIGKQVIVGKYNGSGALEFDQGKVQAVTVFKGETKIYVNDMEYDYKDVMEITEAETVVDEDTPDIKDIFDKLSSIEKLLQQNATVNSVE